MHAVFKEMHRVCLRDWRASDVDSYTELVSDPDVMKYIGNGGVRDEVSARREIEGFQREIEEKGWSRWAVSLGLEGPMMGYVGFSQKSDGIDLGLRFLSQYWNAPYPYISTYLALEYAFETLGFEKVYAMNHVEHSHALAFTKRLISTPSTLVENEFGKFNYFSITKENYLSEDVRRNKDKAEYYCRRFRRSGVAEPCVRYAEAAVC